MLCDQGHDICENIFFCKSLITSWKLCKIDTLLLQITDIKRYIVYQSVPLR